MVDITPLFGMGMPGTPEMVVILLIAVLLFGANKIPKLARSTGEAMGEFKKGRQEVEEELQDMAEPPETGDEEFVESEEVTDEESEAASESSQ